MIHEIVPWRPMTELTRLQDEMNSIFERCFGTALAPERAFAPPVDFCESKDAYLLRMDLPGLDAKDVTITVADNVLTVRGEKRTDREEKEKTFHRIERCCGAFSRTITLPGAVDEGKIAASFKKGVLEIDLPKSPHQRGREIKIQAS